MDALQGATSELKGLNPRRGVAAPSKVDWWGASRGIRGRKSRDLSALLPVARFDTNSPLHVSRVRTPAGVFEPMKTGKPESRRADGRGHWPAGRRRNPDRGNWSRVRLLLVRLIDDYHCPGLISYRAAALAVGVSDRSLRRYANGIQRPAPETQDAIAQWIDERRDALRKGSP